MRQFFIGEDLARVQGSRRSHHNCTICPCAGTRKKCLLCVNGSLWSALSKKTESANTSGAPCNIDPAKQYPVCVWTKCPCNTNGSSSGVSAAF